MDREDRSIHQQFGKLKKHTWLERIKANKIIGRIDFRNHFCSHPGRHSWDLCGHPMYYWKMLAVSKSKYVEKVLFYTEVKEAQKLARELSDKFLIMERSLEECKDPTVRYVNDLKRPDSVVHRYAAPRQTKRDSFKLNPTWIVDLPTDAPLETTETIDRIIEEFAKDDFATKAETMYRVSQPTLVMQDPNNPNHLLPVIWWQATGFFTRRQQYPKTYSRGGVSVRKAFTVEPAKTMMVEVSKEEAVSVHTKEDLELAEFYMSRRLRRERKNENDS